MNARDDRPRLGRLFGPVVAGTWYPSEPAALEQLVGSLLRPAAPVRTPGIDDLITVRGSDRRDGDDVAALVLPHAGLRYSGRVAGATAHTVAGRRTERVVLLGPSHRALFDGVALLDATGYRTPLGDVAIDRDIVDALITGDDTIRLDDGPFVEEHCLEVIVPFLQRALQPGWRLVPGLVGARSGASTLRSIAHTLRTAIDDSTLVVVSSDFTHHGAAFGYVPFTDDLPGRIPRLDRSVIDTLLDWSPEAFDACLQRTRATVCGRDALRLMLRIWDRPLNGSLEDYDTSGRMTGDWSHSVSYAGLSFRRPS